ncbi:soluble scavenger receptor cysteine-rich domain-containing protein SSC5D-like [Ranitomeya imitator]|uniref:soluble scavenger receptor cysteine-rich domain-containing protein SSC5D-like n=1 Tax=Ranitomeya imitator TaxID=111125 RepID=UPI0037E7299D
MVTQSTVGSTREPAAQLNPSGVIPQEAATEGHFDSAGPSAPSYSAPSQPSHTSDPSVPSASAVASYPIPLHVSAGEDIAFPVPHPSAAATSSTPVASGRHRQRGQVQSYAPEFLHQNASFQNCLKVLSEQMATGFNFIIKSILEMHTLLLTMRSEARQSPNNTFFQSVLEQMETLSTSQQMQVMQSCQSTLALIASKAEALATHAATAPLPPLSIITATTILLTCTTNVPVPHPTINHIVPVSRPTSHNPHSVPMPLTTSHTTSVPSVPLPTNMMIPIHTTSHLLHPRRLSLPTTNSLFHLLPNPLLHPSLLLPPNPPKTSPTPLHPTKLLTPIPLSCPPAQLPSPLLHHYLLILPHHQHIPLSTLPLSKCPYLTAPPALHPDIFQSIVLCAAK